MMPPATLAGYSTAELLEFYNEADPAARDWRAQIEAEIDRRAASEDTTRKVIAGTVRSYGTSPAQDEIRAEWERAAHAQYLQAEAACSGYLVRGPSHDYRENTGEPGKCAQCGHLYRYPRHAGVDAFVLWSGSDDWARSHATDELNAFWDAHTRMTLTEYRRQASGERKTWQERHDREPAREGKRIMSDDDTAREVTAGTVAGYGTSPAEDLAARAAAARAASQITARIAERPAGRLVGPQAAPQPPKPGTSGAGTVAIREGTVVAAARPHIDGRQTFGYIFTFLKRFAVWGSDAEIIAATLWVMQAHGRDANGRPIWPYSSRLGIFGPYGSGKSWKAKLIGMLAPSPKILLEPTKPSFLDLCADGHTIIVTEADETFRSPGRARGIVAAINAGYEPDRTATRKHGGKVVEIPVYCPVILDGIDTVMLAGNRPDLKPLISRCIIIRTQKAPDGYRPPRYDGQARDITAQLRLRASAWAAQELAAGMADTIPVVPEHLGNRPYALWEPLFTVAQHADDGDPDGEWSQACRAACEILEAGGFPEPEPGSESDLDSQMAEWAGAF